MIRLRKHDVFVHGIDLRCYMISLGENSANSVMICVIELYDVVFPDETRQTGERLINCSRRTPTQPCRHARQINTFEEPLASATEKLAAENQLDHHIAATPKSERSRSRGDDGDKPKDLISSLFSAFKPASSKTVKKVFANNRRMLP